MRLKARPLCGAGGAWRGGWSLSASEADLVVNLLGMLLGMLGVPLRMNLTQRKAKYSDGGRGKFQLY